jgi:hypothetical protein
VATLRAMVEAAEAAGAELTAAMGLLAIFTLRIGNLTDGNHRTVLGQREH